jgi:hypothetical protein
MYKIGSLRLQLLKDSSVTCISESWLGGYKNTEIYRKKKKKKKEKRKRTQKSEAIAAYGNKGR